MKRRFLQYWAQYCKLDDPHRSWLDAVAMELKARRGTRLFEPGDRGDYVYFVCDGLLATVWWDTMGNRRIDRFLLATHSVLTRNNLYARRQIDDEVIALRRSTVIRIPADALRAYKEACPEADTLVDVMEQKKLKQYQKKNRLILISEGERRYIAFANDAYMKPIYLVTSQQEQADYLGISRMTINRALHRMHGR